MQPIFKCRHLREVLIETEVEETCRFTHDLLH